MGKLLVVEDHALVREGLVAALRRFRRGAEVFEAKDAELAVLWLDDNPDVDLVLLDLMLPGMDGFSFLGVLRKRFAQVPVLVVSGLDDQATIRRVARLGAAGFVPKSCSGEEMLAAVRVVLEGGEYFPEPPPAVGRGVSRKGGSESDVAQEFGLTAGQARVLDLLAAGKSNREIAELLHLTEGTVKIHLSAIYRALNVSSRAQALVAVARRGRHL